MENKLDILTALIKYSLIWGEDGSALRQNQRHFMTCMAHLSQFSSAVGFIQKLEIKFHSHDSNNEPHRSSTVASLYIFQ